MHLPISYIPSTSIVMLHMVHHLEGIVINNHDHRASYIFVIICDKYNLLIQLDMQLHPHHKIYSCNKYGMMMDNHWI